MFRLISIVFLLICVKRCLPLNCYSCSGSSGCGNPFNSLGSGVSTTGTNSANLYCYVQRYIDTYYRGGVSSCTSYWYSSNSYQTCCQSDFCNRTNRLSLNQLIFLIYFLLK